MDNIYEDYYLNQAGSGLPVYSGVATQKGHGLGSIIGGLFRGAMPLLASVGKAVGKQVLKSGIGVASDVISGTNVKQAMKNRAKEGALSLLNQTHKGGGKVRKTVSRRRKPARRRPVTADIFS